MRKISTKFMEVDNAENWIRILEIDEIGALHVKEHGAFTMRSQHVPFLYEEEALSGLSQGT